VRRAGLEPGIAKAALEKLTETKRLHALTLGDERVNVRELARSTSDPDRALANGSSIAFLAEWEGRSVLFGADAHPDVLGAGIGRLLVERGLESLRLDAFKLPHHGSAANLTADLLRLVRCRRYLVSTNGDVFHHPDVEAIARVIVNGGDDPALLFNYRSEQTQLWDDRRMMREYGYSVEYADPTSEGLAVEIA
jgi:beta-lactamase superfamily II metal-dependent hydrolase